MRAPIAAAAAFLGLLALAGPRILAQTGGAPAGPMPKVTAGGIRVVGAGLGENGNEITAFHESPGLTLALFVTAPAGSGIIAIDDDTSVLKSLTDDKGQNLLEGARWGSFPKVARDGSAGVVEVEVRARPSAGAVSVTAQGLVACTLSSGSKPVRLTNVRLEAKQTLKAGTATIKINTVEVKEDSTEIEFGMTRSAMTAIRDVKFFSGDGTPIESESAGSGYMNDDGMMAFRAKTKAKTISIEFELWQNLRPIKAPFNVKIGLGF